MYDTIFHTTYYTYYMPYTLYMQLYLLTGCIASIATLLLCDYIKMSKNYLTSCVHVASGQKKPAMFQVPSHHEMRPHHYFFMDPATKKSCL